MIQLLTPLANLAGSYLQNKADGQAAAAKLKLSEAEAKAKIMLSKETSVEDWNRIMAEGSKHSWKDEFFSVILAAPCCLAFCGEWGRTVVAEGFAALEAMPDYYQYFLGCAIAASFSLRGASKFFGRK